MLRIFYLTAFQSDSVFRFRTFSTLMIMLAWAIYSPGQGHTTLGFLEDTLTPDPTVIASAGGVSHVNDFQLQWTLGESFAGSAFTKNDFFTVGFHQPGIKISIDFKTEIQQTSDVSVFPNPFTHFLNIRLNEKVKGKVKLMITDPQGRSVFENYFFDDQNTPEINIPDIPAGHYTLHLIDSDDKRIQSIIIIKSN